VRFDLSFGNPMTITYPRELHGYELATCTFTFHEGVSVSRTGRGRAISAVEDSDPYLGLSITTRRLMLEERHPWEAWKDSLRGGLKSFLAYDVSRKEPLAYGDGVPQITAGTWDGEGTIATGGLAAHSITAALNTGAPADFKMMAGDHIGLVEGGKYGVFRVTEDATAGSGSIAVSVDPFIPTTVFTTAATVVFRRPKAEFILLSDSWSNPVNTEYAPISFDAVQKL
jgi:hypothetical protein